MPGKLSGVDLASLIRTNYPHVQVLLTTGYAEDKGLAEEIDLIYKPYRAARPGPEDPIHVVTGCLRRMMQGPFGPRPSRFYLLTIAL